MDYRQLRYFIAVAEELSFSRAAKRLNVSQPPLSMQIKAMEAELGTCLLARTRRAVELTPAGQLLLDHARRAVRELDLASEAVRRAARGEAGVVRLGFTGSVPMLDMFAELFRGFRASYPKVRVELRHMSTLNQLKALADTDLDVALMRPPFDFKPAGDLQVHTVWRDQLMAFLPIDHRLASAPGSLKMNDLAEQEFVGMAADRGCGAWDHVSALCRSAGFAPRIVQEARELRTVLGLVAAGIGVSILPSCYRQAGVASVVAKRLDTPDAETGLMIAVRSTNASLLTRRFVDFALQISSQMQRSQSLDETGLRSIALVR